MYIDYVYIVLFYITILYSKYITKQHSSNIYNYVIIISQYIVYLLKF